MCPFPLLLISRIGQVVFVAFVQVPVAAEASQVADFNFFAVFEKALKQGGPERADQLSLKAISRAQQCIAAVGRWRETVLGKPPLVAVGGSSSTPISSGLSDSASAAFNGIGNAGVHGGPFRPYRKLWAPAVSLNLLRPVFVVFPIVSGCRAL